MFIFRAMFWVLLGLLLLPLVPVTAAPGEDAGPSAPGYVELYQMANATLSDAAAFCDREPQVCLQAQAFIASLHRRAIRLTGDLHAWLEAEFAARNSTG